MRTSLILTILLARGAIAAEPDYQWNLPKGFPNPYVPADNPMSAAKVELGRYLFYDARMSVNGKQSCAAVTSRSSHSPTDALSVSARPANPTRTAP